MVGKSTQLQVISQQSTQHSKLAVTDIRQKPVDFFNNTAWASPLALAIILKIQIPLQKFSFLLRYTIPCIHKYQYIPLFF